MKVIGFISNRNQKSIGDRLVEYALSLFTLVDTEMIALDESDYSQVSKGLKTISEKIEQSILVVISIPGKGESLDTAVKTLLEKLLKEPQGKNFHEKPILLLTTTLQKDTGDEILASFTEKFTRNGSEVWDAFSLPHFNDSLDSEGNASAALRLALIRKVNAIMYKKLRLKNDNYFTCGIDPERDPCGDAIEY